jgi:hypothetical protein
MEDNWKHKSENMRCKACMYFVIKRDTQIGRCRRNAPTMSGWPVMYTMDWCGQHKLDESKI